MPRAGSPFLGGERMQSGQASGHPYTDLRRREQDPRVLESGRVAAEEVQVLDHAPPGFELDHAEVLDVEAAVARQARPHEDGDVVAPAHVRSVDEAELLTATGHEVAVALRIAPFEVQPAPHVHPGPGEGGVHAVLDVAAGTVGPGVGDEGAA